MPREMLSMSEQLRRFEALFFAAREFQRSNTMDNQDRLFLAAYRVSLAKGSYAELEREERRLTKQLDIGPRVV